MIATWQWAKANPDAAARRIRELERENAMFRRALADALSTFQHENEVIVTAERVEAWKAALSNGSQ